jgi:hypothetical protein
MHSKGPQKHRRGEGVVEGQGMQGGRGQTLAGRASRLALGSLAPLTSVFVLTFRLVKAQAAAQLQPRAQMRVRAGAPSDGIWRGSTVQQTNVSRHCCESDSMQSQIRAQDHRASNLSLGSICFRRGQTPVRLYSYEKRNVSAPRRQ